MNLSQDYDRKLFADGRALINLHSRTEIRAYFASIGSPLDDRDNAYAAAFGRLQAIAHELLIMAARNA